MANSAEQRHERLLWGKTTEFLGASEPQEEPINIHPRVKAALQGLMDEFRNNPMNPIDDILDAVRAEHANGDDTEHDRDCGD